MLATLAKRMTQYRWQLLMAALIVMGVFAVGLASIKMTSELRTMMHSGNSGMAVIDELEAHFDIPRSFIVFVYHQKNQLDYENLKLIDEFARSLELAPSVSSVRSLANSSFIFSQDDSIFIENIYDPRHPAAASNEHYRKIEQWLLNEPTLVDSFISDDSLMSAIVVNTFLDQSAPGSKIREVKTFLQNEAGEFEQKNPHYRVDIVGELAFDLAEEDALNHDLVNNMVWSLALIFIILLIIFRSILSALFIFVVSVFSCASAIGFAGFMGLHINNINTTAPVVILVVAVLDGIHFISIYQNKRASQEIAAALQSAIELSFKPITLTTITTAIGFIALNISSSPAIASLGTITAFGILMAWVFSFGLLPALATLIKGRELKNSLGWIERLLEPLTNIVCRHSGKIIIGFATLFILLASQIPNIVIDDNPFESLDEDLPFMQSQMFVQDKMHSNAFSLYVDTGQPGGINNAKLLGRIDELSQWLKTQPSVINVYSYSDHIKRINQIMHGDQASEYQVPPNDDLIAQYGLLYKFSVPSPDEVTRYTDGDDQRLVVSVLTDEISIVNFNALVADIKQQAKQLGIDDVLRVTGWSVVFNAEKMVWITELLQGFALAFLFISLLMFLFFRSMVIGTISLVPNLLPLAITFGLWGLAQQQLDFITLLVLSASFGIVIDDTIHYMTKFSDHFNTHRNTREAIAYAYRYSGPAITVTTIALAIGLSPMLFSQLLPMQSISKLIIPIVLFALIIDLILLPAILYRVYRDENVLTSPDDNE